MSFPKARNFRLVIACALSAATMSAVSMMAANEAFAAAITLNSSGAVTFLDSGFTSSDFSSPFTAANFTAAQTGPAAFVLSSTPFYAVTQVNGSSAQWIGTNSSAGTGVGDTALFAISFNIPGAVSSASFNLFYAVDNNLGDTNSGIYINGTALPSSAALPTGCFDAVCAFNITHQYTDANIASLLVSGTNWLYLDGVNLGGQEGIIFSADISTASTTAVPEPVTLSLFGAGLAGVLTVRRRKKTRS